MAVPHLTNCGLPPPGTPSKPNLLCGQTGPAASAARGQGVTPDPEARVTPVEPGALVQSADAGTRAGVVSTNCAVNAPDIGMRDRRRSPPPPHPRGTRREDANPSLQLRLAIGGDISFGPVALLGQATGPPGGLLSATGPQGRGGGGGAVRACSWDLGRTPPPNRNVTGGGRGCKCSYFASHLFAVSICSPPPPRPKAPSVGGMGDAVARSRGPCGGEGAAGRSRRVGGTPRPWGQHCTPPHRTTPAPDAAPFVSPSCPPPLGSGVMGHPKRRDIRAQECCVSGPGSLSPPTPRDVLEGGEVPPPPPGRPAYAQPLSP